MKFMWVKNHNFVFKQFLLWLSFLLTCTYLYGNDSIPPYAFRKIPKNLLLNANVVVRTSEISCNIENSKLTKVKYHYVLTLLNENADDKRLIYIPYTSFNSISGIKTSLYDSNGDIILHAKPTIFDISGNFEDLANDLRYWIISFPLKKYPYTIEYEYEETRKDYFIGEHWNFQDGKDISIQQSNAQFIVPKNLGFRTFVANTKHACDTFSMPDKHIYTWQERNIPAFSPAKQVIYSFDPKYPKLIAAANTFHSGNIEGQMDTWKAFGKWTYELNKNRDELSPELKKKLIELTSSVSDKKEKVKLIYDYLQKTTRYVGIQLGIGGYQTLEASFVERKGYGDCKALSNYMKAMLKGIGIPSYQALVLSGQSKDILTGFPSQQFDHVILCVPMEKDSIWLECTDQTIPFNFLGYFTCDRHVLLFSEDGGKLVKTPSYKKEANTKSSNFKMALDNLGTATLTGHMAYSGLLYEHPIDNLKEGKKSQEKWVNEIISNPNVNILNIDFQELEKKYPQVKVDCQFQLNNQAFITEKRILLNPDIFTPVNYIPRSMDDDFSLLTDMVTSDTISINIPYGYQLNNMPENKSIDTEFGSLKINYSKSGDQVVFSRNLFISEGKYKKGQCDEFRNFFDEIAASDRKYIIFEKKN